MCVRKSEQNLVTGDMAVTDMACERVNKDWTHEQGLNAWTTTERMDKDWTHEQGLNTWTRTERMNKDWTHEQGLNAWTRTERMDKVTVS